MLRVKNIIKQLFNRLGWDIVRRRPEPSLDAIQLALRCLAASESQATFVQIGACDGVVGDHAHDFIRSKRFKAYLVEPMPDNFRDLTAKYRNVPHVELINAAISNTEGEVQLYSVDPSLPAHNPLWTKQLASLNKQHLNKHGIDARFIRETTVPAITLSTLRKRYDIGRIDILQIDAEGFDHDIVNMALMLPNLPDCICFEYIHVPVMELDELLNRLGQHGYKYLYDKWNVLAVHEKEFNGSMLRDPLTDADFANALDNQSSPRPRA